MVRPGFGSVFPALDALIATTERSDEGSKMTIRQGWRCGIYSRKSAERAGFEYAQTARIGAASSGYRALSDGDTPATHVDEVLNATHLDRDLDQAGGVEAPLAKELEACRLARLGNVVALTSKKRE